MDHRPDPDENKMCSCWKGSLVCFWSRSCREEIVIDASKGVIPAMSQSAAYLSRGNLHKRTPSKKVGSVPLTPEINIEIPQNSNLRVFRYNEPKAATRNFRLDNALGQGGFGVVYKGWIDDLDGTALKVVAVKVLNHDGQQGHREWMTEVNYLGQLRHVHLVKLMGYACEDEHRLLVYEYMSRGSLENHLFRKTTPPLSWLKRMSIALGAAKGLAFLHGSERPVIYRDFKTSNVLLDSQCIASGIYSEAVRFWTSQGWTRR